MVQIKLSVAFILAVTAIAPIVAVPVGEKTTVPTEVDATPNAGSKAPAAVPKMAVLDSTGTPEAGSKASANGPLSEPENLHKGKRHHGVKGKHHQERQVTGSGHGQGKRHRGRRHGHLNLEDPQGRRHHGRRHHSRPRTHHHKAAHKKKRVHSEEAEVVAKEKAEVVTKEKVESTPLAAREDFAEVFERTFRFGSEGSGHRGHNGKRHSHEHEREHEHRQHRERHVHAERAAEVVPGPQENGSQLGARDDFAEEFERSFDDTDDLAARDDFDEMFDLE